MNQQKQNILIIETKDGAKYQGIYVSKDLQKQILTLSNVKKTFQQKEESFPMIDLKRDDIASINIIDFRPPKEDIHNINEIPDNKKNTIDESQLANIEKAYDKSRDNFFDRLKPMNNPEVKKITQNYNLKNKDTFNLPANDNDDNKREFRGRGIKRGNIKNYGRGGYGRGRKGGFHNNIYKNEHNYYNRNYKNEDNYKGKNYIRGRGIRGRGKTLQRGNRNKYNNNFYNNNDNNQNNNNPNEQNNNNNES